MRSSAIFPYDQKTLPNLDELWGPKVVEEAEKEGNHILSSHDILKTLVLTGGRLCAAISTIVKKRRGRE